MPVTKATSLVNRSAKPMPREERARRKEIHSDIIAALVSNEADAITPLMSKIYLTLINAPSVHCEREGVVHFTSQKMNGEWQSAWAQLIRLIDVEGEAAHRALGWMHEQRIITYWSDEDGADIQIIFELDESGRYIRRPI